MYMFLPFLLALLTVVGSITDKPKISLGLFFLLIVIAFASFSHHATDPLKLSF